MLEIALSRLDIESVMGCSDIDLSVFPLADRTEIVLEYIIVEIAFTLVAVVADKTVRLGCQPDVLLTVFHHAVNTDNVLQCTANLVGILLVGQLQQSVSRCANQYFAVLTLQ